MKKNRLLDKVMNVYEHPLTIAALAVFMGFCIALVVNSI